MNYKKSVVAFEMFLLISLSITTSLIIADLNKKYGIYENEATYPYHFGDKALAIVGFIGRLILSEKGIVSALNSGDLENGLWTCLEGKDGSVCQEYIASECKDKCNGACIPSEAREVDECKLVSCVDTRNGGCQLGVPKKLCEKFDSNIPYDDPFGNIPQCRAYCCLFAGKAAWIPAAQCEIEAKRLGASYQIKTEATNELECIALRQNVVEGACLYGKADNGKNLCKFTSEIECKKTIKGDFREGKLCSNLELNTTCEKQKTTACVLGKDGVYWQDSCGNRENIYSSDLTGSWNSGNILEEENSCAIGTPDKPLLNYEDCGNCNQIWGSVCAKSDFGIGKPNYACKNLNCMDKNGNERISGESWCEYQGAAGVDTDISGGRSMDTVGSLHYRKTCYKGDIITENCDSYRNAVCVETKSPINGTTKTASTAACTMNRWHECISYNSNKDSGAATDLCNKNPFCFAKEVSIGDYKFSACAPKFAPGYKWEEEGRGEGSEAICKMASLKCTKVEVKKIVGVGLFGEPKTKWVCKGGCECDKPEFTQQINDFCTSLGDCGAKANYIGHVEEDYSITRNGVISDSQVLSPTYLNILSRYADENFYKDRYANAIEFFRSGFVLIPDGLGAEAEVQDSLAAGAEAMNQINMYAGMAGLVLTVGAWGAAALGSYLAGLGAEGGTAILSGQLGGSIAPALSGAAGVIAGAAAGMAVVSMLLSMTGVSRGIPEWMTYSLIAAGAVAGGIIGTAAFAGPSFTIFGAVPIIGWIILIIIVVIIVILTVLGVGKVRKTNFDFTCNPWQAPNGGSECSKCGKDGFPCSRYACISLGQTCDIINEDSSSPECIDIGKGDVLPPVIKPWKVLIAPRGHNYTDINENGFRIVSENENGCIAPYTQLAFGLSLNEPGICKQASIHTDNIEKMLDFGVSHFYRRNITQVISVPPISSLGYEDALPNATGEYEMYIRCMDKPGNININEYKIGFCIHKGLDLTAPEINDKQPYIDYLAYGENERNVTLKTNEPSECNWDYDDRDYDLMAHQMQCQNSLEQDMFDWKCFDTWKSGKNDSTNFYVRCKDQPWLAEKKVAKYTVNKGKYLLPFGMNTSDLEIQPYDAPAVNFNYRFAQFIDYKGVYYIQGENESLIREWDNFFFKELKAYDGGGEANITKEILNETAISDVVDDKGRNLMQGRNINTQSKIFQINKTKYKLAIDSIIPNGTIIEVGSLPASVNVVVKTSGGVRNGEARCSYVYGVGQPILFADTLRNVHKQSFYNLWKGRVNLPISCIDLAGNNASGVARFEIKADLDSPKVSRVYSSGGTISFVTDELAKCVYSDKDCDYQFNNGTAIDNSLGINHNFNSDIDTTYYVKCKDNFENSPGSSCNLVVKQSRAGALIL